MFPDSGNPEGPPKVAWGRIFPIYVEDAFGLPPLVASKPPREDPEAQDPEDEPEEPPIEVSARDEALKKCKQHFNLQRWATPPGDNAAVHCNEVLKHDPNNAVALGHIKKMKNFYFDKWAEAIGNGDRKGAYGWITGAWMADPRDPEINQIRTDLARDLQSG